MKYPKRLIQSGLIATRKKLLHSAFCILPLFSFCVLPSACLLPVAAQETPGSQTKRVEHKTRTLRGKVVWLSAALERLHEINEVPEVAERVLALETSDGQLFPLIEDVRGRGFRRDARLRDTELELLVRQHEGVPFVQVIQVFQFKEGVKYELDYWCEICAIAMFELKDCECCQGPIELRAREVKR